MLLFALAYSIIRNALYHWSFDDKYKRDVEKQVVNVNGKGVNEASAPPPSTPPPLSVSILFDRISHLCIFYLFIFLNTLSLMDWKELQMELVRKKKQKLPMELVRKKNQTGQKGATHLFQLKRGRKRKRHQFPFSFRGCLPGYSYVMCKLLKQRCVLESHVSDLFINSYLCNRTSQRVLGGKMQMRSLNMMSRCAPTLDLSINLSYRVRTYNSW